MEALNIGDGKQNLSKKKSRNHEIQVSLYYVYTVNLGFYDLARDRRNWIVKRKVHKNRGRNLRTLVNKNRISLILEYFRLKIGFYDLLELFPRVSNTKFVPYLNCY